LIEAKALRWLLIVSGVIVATLTFPPIGILLIFGLMGCGIFRMNRWRARRAAERAAYRQMYWKPDTIARRYYS
jgi:hypothetical protein